MKRGQASLYLVLSLFIFIIVAVAFAAWSAKLSALSAENREDFVLSLSGKRVANALDLVERNNVGIEMETKENITFSDVIEVCRRKCVKVDSLPPTNFRITESPNGLRIEK